MDIIGSLIDGLTNTRRVGFDNIVDLLERDENKHTLNVQLYSPTNKNFYALDNDKTTPFIVQSLFKVETGNYVRSVDKCELTSTAYEQYLSTIIHQLQHLKNKSPNSTINLGIVYDTGHTFGAYESAEGVLQQFQPFKKRNEKQLELLRENLF